ncbi:common central domain of tyrosinase-domain-containing protein [Suillus tomentosus]|nr:common central domain of tyrosinase-domain-containing protein [Suillus tomentosus]
MNSVEYHYPVIGRKCTGGIFDRLPIQTLEKDHPHQFALFLAFNAIQQRSDAPHVVKRPAATFMETASIHGKPYVEWAADYSSTDKKDTNPVPSRFGVSRHTSSRSVDLKPFFSHGAVVFPTWHRSYVMLIEQSIGNIAEQLAHDNEADNPDENGVWIKAAKELRFPYWDWAGEDVPENGLPPVLYEEKVEIMATGGEKQIVDNPLSFFSYVGGIPADFSDEKDDLTGQVAYFSKWRRTYRYAYSTPDPEGSHIYLLQKMFKARAKNLRLRVAHLFTFNDDENYPSALLTWFASVLHSSVDRLYWEWCYTEYWMGSGYEHDGEKYPWTQARGTYAHFEGIKVDQTAMTSQERALARKRVQAYYDFDPQTKATADTEHLPVPNKENTAVPNDHTVIPHYRTFIVHLKLLEHAYNHSYSFQLHHKGIAHSTQLVGTVAVFARPDHYPCKACAARREVASVVRGMIPIPPELTESIIKSNGGTESGTSLVDTTGLELAGAEGGLQATQVPQHCTTSHRVTPVEISLVSAAVAEHVEDKDRPVHV